jgi:hypothetical protein
VTGTELAHRRLRRQRLCGPPLPGPTDVVSWFGAMQAQEHALADWSIGKRAHRHHRCG